MRPPAPDAVEPAGRSLFVGDWHTEGTSFADGQIPEDPRASGVPWISDEHYEWLPGGLFLLHRWDAVAGTRKFKGIEIIDHVWEWRNSGTARLPLCERTATRR